MLSYKGGVKERGRRILFLRDLPWYVVAIY